MRPAIPFRASSIAALALQALSCLAYGAAEQAKASARPAVAVLDPVDLNTGDPDPQWGEFLRHEFASNPSWKPIPRDSMRAKEKEFGFAAYRNCHEFQCAFDAGNIFNADYVLFSSISRLGGVYAYTLNLLQVSGSRTAWSRVGEAGGGRLGNPRLTLEVVLARQIGRLAPGKPKPARKEKRGQITLLDLSPDWWPPARVMAERVSTHMYAAGAFDIMGRREQDELTRALGIDKASFIPTDSAVLALGEKLGVSHLVCARMARNSRQEVGLELGYYEVAADRKTKSGHSGYAQDFSEVFSYETAFLSSLFPIEADARDGLESPGRFRVSWLAAAAGAAIGVAGGIAAYRLNEASRAKYRQIEKARSRESAVAIRGDAANLARDSRIWGAVGLAGLLAGGVSMAFSF